MTNLRIFLLLIAALTIVLIHGCKAEHPEEFGGINCISNSSNENYIPVKMAVELIKLQDTLIVDSVQYFGLGGRVWSLNSDLDIKHIVYLNKDDPTIAQDSISINGVSWSIAHALNLATGENEKSFLLEYIASRISIVGGVPDSLLIVTFVPSGYSSSSYINSIELNLVFSNFKNKPQLIFSCINPLNAENVIVCELNDNPDDVELLTWNPASDTLKCIEINSSGPKDSKKYLILEHIESKDSFNIRIDWNKSHWYNKPVLSGKSENIFKLSESTLNYPIPVGVDLHRR